MKKLVCTLLLLLFVSSFNACTPESIDQKLEVQATGGENDTGASIPPK